MLVSPEGSIPAAGIPWFVAAFGRDSLLTATMLLPHHPWVSRGVLEYLGHYQGQEVNEFRGEEPGKIMHEIRLGELARKGKVPHSPYYGTIDATPLYIILLEELWEHTRDDELLRIFQPNWEACLDWMLNYGDQDQDGFLEYISAAPGKGLVVQSWKDSDDSMSHSDGTLAAGYIRPAEVQGYAYRAFSAAAKFYQTLGNPEKAAEFKTHAEKLKQNFDTVFWNDSICCYAMALDGEHRPLLVKNSNAGQLLWTGIVPKERAAALVSTLMGDELYSGWGIRTLGTKEVRYNPVSYHNGSVWPHDTALIAMGLWKYRFISEAEQLVRDLFDLAGSQGDRRLPELIAGYPRSSSPPVPYPVACRPQAWDAAALVYLHPLLMRD
jgi:glycogen debranching enzyme